MRSSKGSSRGRLPRSPPSPASDSSSPSALYVSDRYPNTRSGRGRSRALRSQPSQIASPASNIPSSSQQPLHSAQFIYRCSLNQPLIAATISITFHEEPANKDGRPTCEELASDDGCPHCAKEKRDNPQDKTTAEEKNSDPQAKGNTGVLQQEENNMDAYRCFIIEEHPSAPHDT